MSIHFATWNVSYSFGLKFIKPNLSTHISFSLYLFLSAWLFLSDPIHLHSYGIANSAYRSLQDQNDNQCICIVGENGSGKTESARIILHFLSNVHSEHTLTGKHIFHNQNSTRLQRCKSLAAYPKYESTETPPSRPTRRDSIKNAHKSHVSTILNKKDIQTPKQLFFFSLAISFILNISRNQQELLNLICGINIRA